MKTETKQLIIAELEKFMTDHGLSANDVAKKSTVNASFISLMRNGATAVNAGGGKTSEIADKYFEMIADFIGLKLEKSYWETVPTEQMIRILATLEDAKKFGYTNVIIGDTGCGKTYVANLFARNNPIDLFHITVSSLDNISDIIGKICDKISIPTEKTKGLTLKRIAMKLRTMQQDGHKPMLIFDEAEYMKAPALCNMKELYDSLNGYCSIVLMGTSQLIRHIDKLRKKDRDGIPQFYRRVKFGIRTLPSIDRNFKQFVTNITDTGLVNFIRENCENYGELHDVLVPAIREAERTGQPLTENFVRTILNMPKL